MNREDIFSTLIKEIRANYKKNKADYILSTPEIKIDMMAIKKTKGMDITDLLAVAKTRRIINDKKLVEKYENLTYREPHHYFTMGSMWFRFEGNRLEIKNHHPPTNGELSEDFKTNKEGIGFRIFYCIRHTKNVKYKT